MTTTPLLVFAGSARTHSVNRQLARAAAKLAQEAGAQVTLIELGDFDIPMYNADLETRGTPADVLRLKQLLFDHPAWIIATPEYNGSLPGLLKNAIDWASSPVKADPLWASGSKPFQGKVVGMLSASPGGLGGLRAQAHLAQLLLNLQCWVTPTAYALARAGEAFDAHGALVQDAQRKAVAAVIAQTLWAGQRLQA